MFAIIFNLRAKSYIFFKNFCDDVVAHNRDDVVTLEKEDNVVTSNIFFERT